MSELSRRIETIRETEQQQDAPYLKVPVVSFDALLPGQKLEGQTTDPTFCRLLQTLGLGGQFVMISINNSKRMLRRNGVVCRIEIMDAKASTEIEPTAVNFVVSGTRRCRLVGPSEQFRTRVGRWRRSHDPDGEESRLGWGDERFVDALPEVISMMEEDTEEEDVSALQVPEPSTSWVDCQLYDDSDSQNEQVVALAQEILPLLERWEKLASDPKTFENTNVVATARVMKGFPGLRVDPAALIRQVKTNLGPIPSSPTDLAFWGAALINPLPPLGVSPEIRGRILEAPSSLRRLETLKWGVNRSIRNLQGTDPL
jgi:hypothetical protein